MNTRIAVAGLATTLLLAACANGPLDYRAEAPVAIRGASLDSLQTLSVTTARRLGLTVYLANAALARLKELGLGVNASDDFLYADHAHGCGLFCKQIDFVTVMFEDSAESVQVDAGSYQRPALLAEWRLVKPSSQIRATADSLAAALGTGVVRRSEIK